MDTATLRYLSRKAIKDGTLVVPNNCEDCGAEVSRLDCHHNTEDDPLNVSFLCKPCHWKRHPSVMGGVRFELTPIAICNQCDHAWSPRVTSPKYCPRCKRIDWNQENKATKKQHRLENLH